MTRPTDPVARVALFGRLLHDAGLRSGAGRLRDAVEALGCVDIGDLEQVGDALRPVFTGSREDVEVFDAAFRVFWFATSDTTALLGSGQRAPTLPMDPERAGQWADMLDASGTMRPTATLAAPADASGWSAVEVLRHRNFRDMTWDETLQARRLLRQATWRIAERRSRRRRDGRGGAVELRRTMRTAARRGGEAIRLERTRHRTAQRPLVILCDVSGSMDRYSRQLLVFAHTVALKRRVETFAFSTRLSRITHLLRRGDVDAALDHVAAHVHDIGGGTRIGAALHDFNRRWARRVLGHGAVVLLISDGWDRGDAAQLGVEMARLHRSCHRLIWLNPLIGDAGYAPETRGMRAALPHCDDFIAAHDLEALDELGRLLAALPSRRLRGAAPQAKHEQERREQTDGRPGNSRWWRASQAIGGDSASEAHRVDA